MYAISNKTGTIFFSFQWTGFYLVASFMKTMITINCIHMYNIFIEPLLSAGSLGPEGDHNIDIS